MKTARIAPPLLALLLAAGCSKQSSESQPPPVGNEKATSQAPQTDTSPITLSWETNGLVINYRVAQAPDLKADETPALIILLSRPDGPALDRDTILARDLFGVIWTIKTGYVAGYTNAFGFLFNTLGDKDMKFVSAYRIVSTDGAMFRAGATIPFPTWIFSDPYTHTPAGGGPAYIDWEWLGSEAKVSIALVALKNGQKRLDGFDRFLTDVTTKVFKTRRQ